jgi:hypothetical protein
MDTGVTKIAFQSITVRRARILGGKSMRRVTKRGIGFVVLIGLLVAPGLAWAAGETAESQDAETEQVPDTLFTFGYDILHHVFAWNLSALDGQFDCSLDGSLTATYGGPTAEGVIPISNLEDDGAIVMFPNRPEAELAEGLDPADAPIPYSGADGECGLSGGDVSGPAGQVNHGMFMKLFNSLYEGAGRGCVVRHLAQSELGKGEQQVGPGGDPSFESVVAGDTGDIDFTSISAVCERTDKKIENGEGEDTHRGNRPDSAGKPDSSGRPDSPGKSGSAPGHND